LKLVDFGGAVGDDDNDAEDEDVERDLELQNFFFFVADREGK